MAVLVMDTATETLAVAVGEPNQLIGSASYRVARGHSTLLQPVIQEVLLHANVPMQSLSSIAVGIGPGSYTGVRIGVSTAKAMALALGIELTTIPTLLTLAEAAAPGSPPNTTVLSLLYARRQRAFGAIYRKLNNGRWAVVQNPQVRLVSDWIELFQAAKPHAPQSVMVPRSVIAHDFIERYGLFPALESAQAEEILHLGDVAGQFGPALLRLAGDGELPRAVGPEIHRIAPEYALPVEAEAKLAERGTPGHGNT